MRWRFTATVSLLFSSVVEMPCDERPLPAMGVANFQLIAALRALEEIPFLYLIRDDLGTVVEAKNGILAIAVLQPTYRIIPLLCPSLERNIYLSASGHE